LAFKKVKSKIKTRWVYLSAFSPSSWTSM